MPPGCPDSGCVGPGAVIEAEPPPAIAAEGWRAERVADGFVRRDVEAGEDVSYGYSLAVDGAGTAHVAWVGAKAGELRWAAFPAGGGEPARETVDATVDAGMPSAIAVLEDGRPVVAYAAPRTGEVRVATRGPGGWTIVTAGRHVEVGAIALKALGVEPRVAIAEGRGKDVLLLRPQ